MTGHLPFGEIAVSQKLKWKSAVNMPALYPNQRRLYRLYLCWPFAKCGRIFKWSKASYKYAEMKGKNNLQTILLISLAMSATLCNSLPLSTRGRWIVDNAAGGRVKMACVNWVSHLEPLVTEGIHAQPVERIAETVKAMGFNCIRLTYATFMWTRADYNNRTVAQSLDSFNLTQAKEGIARNNPKLLNLQIIDAYEAVVNELGAHGLMLVLDNHVSKPLWCCAREDGNGFFGDMYFDPKEWIKGLTDVSTRFKNNPQVVVLIYIAHSFS